MIVIGVDQMGISRPYEYLPYKDTIFDPDSPEPAGKLFPDFLAHDILPLIDGRYRTTKVPRMIGGASYGAVAALYALLARPDLFDAGLIESPSLGVGNGQFLRDTDHLFRGPSKVFLGSGAKEFGDDPGGPDNSGYPNDAGSGKQSEKRGAGSDQNAYRDSARRKALAAIVGVSISGGNSVFVQTCPPLNCDCFPFRASEYMSIPEFRFRE